MNKIYHFLSVGLFALLISCEQKDLFYLDSNNGGSVCPDETTHAKVGVDVDWSLVKEKPVSMTLLAYSDKGYYLREVQSDSLDYGKIYLPLGYSSVMAISDSTTNLHSIYFRKLEKLDEAQVCALPIEPNSFWYEKYVKDVSLTQQPQNFMTAVKDSVKITYDIIDSVRHGVDTTAVRLQPLDCVQSVTIRVRIKNIYRLVSVEGIISGLAEGYQLKANRPTNTSTAHLISADKWKCQLDAKNPMNGCIVCSFKTFGCPGQLDFKLGNYDLRLHIQYALDQKWDDELILDIENKIIRDGDGWIIDLTDDYYLDLDELPNDDGNMGDKDESENGSINVEIDKWKNE